MSQTIELELPDAVHESLLKKAEKTGVSPQVLIASLVEAAVNEKSDDDPLESFIGAFDSQNADWIDRHDEYTGHSVMSSGTERPA